MRVPESMFEAPGGTYLNAFRRARALAADGWAVVPLHHPSGYGCSCRKPLTGDDRCTSVGKHPRTRNGLKDASNDPRQIDTWHAQYPQANWAIVLPDRVVVIDVDPKSRGDRSWARLLADHPDWTPGAALVRIRTGRTGENTRGVHVYLRSPGGVKNNANPATGIDRRSSGGYVVAPGSWHPSGVAYEGTVPALGDVSDWPLAPAWALAASEPSGGGKSKPGAGNLPGGRNNELNRQAFQLGKAVKQGELDMDTAAKMAVDNAVAAGLTGTEVAKTAKSGLVAGLHKSGNFENCTDLGNARRLVNAEEGKLLFVPAWGQWLVWDGRRWTRDDTAEVYRRAKDVVRGIYTEAALCEDSDERQRLSKWSGASESRSRIEAMIATASTEPEFARGPGQFDSHPFLLSVGNGTLDLKTGKLRPADPTDMLTLGTEINYDPAAEARLWRAFLTTVTRGDDTLAGYLQRASGYTLTGNTDEHCLFFGHGGGANGKSTFLEVMRMLLGGLAISADPELLLRQAFGAGHPSNVAVLRGMRMVICSEIGEDRQVDDNQVKRLTGGDTISARFMGKDWFDFQPVGKIWIAANHLPVVSGTDEGFWRRWKQIPFTAHIPPAERVAGLARKLVDLEGPGILAWAVAGCVQWQAGGLQEPSTVTATTQAYRVEQDTLGAFVDQYLEFGDDLRITKQRLYVKYTDWYRAEGADLREKLTQAQLVRKLKERASAQGVTVVDGKKWRLNGKKPMAGLQGLGQLSGSLWRDDDE